MISYSLVFGAVNLLIYLPIIYYSYKAVEAFESEEDVASAMFFLKDDTPGVFRKVSLMVSTVLIGEVLIFASHYYSQLFRAVGYLSLTFASLAVLYFVKNMAQVTQAPSKE